MQNGKIILLNGASSSGKTSIATALQKQLKSTYLHVGIDTFIKMFPNDYVAAEDEEKRKRILSAMHACITMLASTGHNLIVDHVIDEPDFMNNIISQLSNFKVTFVGVHCPLEILEMREASRSDRQFGLAKSHFQKVHVDKMYDFEIDTSQSSPKECAHKIIDYIHDSKMALSAFDKLHLVTQILY